MKGKGRRPDTRLVRAGRRREWTSGIVNPPVYRASTVLFDSVADLGRGKPPRDGLLDYGRTGTPTSWALAEALTELEPGAAGTKLFPSGLAAVAGALLSVLRGGDELLVADSCYGPTRAFCGGLLTRFGVSVRYYDPLVGGGIAELIGDRTRAIFMESPGSLTMEVQDVPAIVAAARERGVATLLDNTWATPLFFPALGAGVDLSILSCTKYVVGHSDAMLGCVTAAPDRFAALDRTARQLGQMAAPDDAWLASRGLRTLSVRLKQHQENALTVARWLAEQPQVARVLHPAHPSCPGHAVWQRDFKGASSPFSFVLNGGDAAARGRLIDSLELFGIGYSWGGFESLVLPADPIRTAASRAFEGPLVRLHIGLEDPEDLIEDLSAALERYP